MVHKELVPEVQAGIVQFQVAELGSDAAHLRISKLCNH